MTGTSDGAGVLTGFAGFCAAVRRAKQHVTDPGSGKTTGNPGQERTAL